MAKETKQYLINGRVQGVGFRAFTARMAQKVGVHGWVRNLEDGRVEAVAQGDSDQLKEFSEHLQQGPSLSSVDSIEEQDISLDESFASFDVTTDGEKPWSKV